MAAKNAKPLVVAEGDVVGSEPIRDQTFTVGLDERAGLGGDGLVEFNFGVEVSAIEEDFVEAGIAEGALECLLAARVFVGGGFPSATNAFRSGGFLFDSNGFTDGLGGGMSGAPYVVLGALVDGEVVEVVEVLTPGGSVALESLQRKLLRLRMRIAQRNRCEGFHGGVWIRAETRQLGDGGGGQSSNFRRGQSQETREFRESGRVGAPTKFQSTLHRLVMELTIH